MKANKTKGTSVTQLTVKSDGVEWQVENYSSMLNYAHGLIKSGFLPSTVKTPEQAVAIIITGRELGIQPMQALRQINVIQGKPTVSPELMLALARSRVPGFVCNIIESSNQKCVIEFSRPNHKPLVQTFTMADATAMGLAGKDNWKKQAAVMLRWRCISAGLRLIAPEAIMGCYTHEEMAPDAVVDYNTGDMISLKHEAVEAEVVEEPKKSKAPTTPTLAKKQGSPEAEKVIAEFLNVNEDYTFMYGEDAYSHHLKNSKGEFPTIAQIKKFKTEKQINWLKQATEKMTAEVNAEMSGEGEANYA